MGKKIKKKTTKHNDVDLLAADQDLVLTPGGYRPRQLVRQLGPDEVLKVTSRQLEIIDERTNKKQKFLQDWEVGRQVFAIDGGWICFSGWWLDQGDALLRFAATWEVPQEPTVKSDQTLFLFNGMQNTGSIYSIVQPVLQWGGAQVGGGQYWAATSWHVSSNGGADYKALVRVNPGDQLTGVISLLSSSRGLFKYRCEFTQFPQTKLDIEVDRELRWCTEALEAYRISKCSFYPPDDGCRFHQTHIQTKNGIEVSWQATNQDQTCGQHCEIVSKTEVKLFYR